MKNMYRATRPAWADMEGWERFIIFAASLALGIFAAAEDHLTPRLGKGWMAVIDVFAVTVGGVVLVWYYKRQRVGCYPSTFIYCFYMPGISNPNGKSQVVGYCYIRPNRTTGEIIVAGASFFWDNDQLNIDSRVGFTSTQVRATQEGEDTTCHIQFTINRDEPKQRLYEHGHLQFQLTNRTAATKDGDGYVGYLESTRGGTETSDGEIQSKGYAELYRKGRFPEDDIRAALNKRGGDLFAALDVILRAVPPPDLWKGKNQMYYGKKNFWGLQIPTPQSVILNHELYPHIEKFLSKVLGLLGLDDHAVERFKVLAREKARSDDALVAYERSLKIGLIGQVERRKENGALADRASVIYGEIQPYLDGDSLLDIGCGNGLVANLAKARFKYVQLLDVVEYVPSAFNLPFELYKEGDPLPLKESFDTVLLLTVLHHSADPVGLLQMAWKATKKRLIIIESVVCVHQLERSVNYELVKLSDENQIAYAAFVDWFYNRVLHDDVPVPYNFTRPDNWEMVFLQHKMHLAKAIHLGQDIDIGPEYHVLFVLEKE